jgi:hypothetical protein
MKILMALPVALSLIAGSACGEPNEEQLAKWLKQFPQADTDGDGKLNVEEALAYREKMRGGAKRSGGGIKTTFKVDPGWDAERFPDDAMCYCTPEKLKAIYPKVVSYKKPADGGLRIVGTGHSFMAPGYRTFPAICRSAGFEQPLHTHTGGGMTGSARYKWEQENGIFEFEGKPPQPKLLASIANAEWDAMMWGPYFNDRPEYYSCWIDFCLKHHPHMKFYLSDAWPSIRALDDPPKSEDELTDALFVRLGKEKHAGSRQLMAALNKKYPGKVFVMPTSAAMVLAVQYYHRGELPGIEGIHRAVGKKERSLWKDPLGHLGPGFDRLEGYVFYATIYRKSPLLIEGDVNFGNKSGNFPSRELDKVFRKIAWEAVVNNPLSGVTDKDGDGIGDAR